MAPKKTKTEKAEKPKRTRGPALLLLATRLEKAYGTVGRTFKLFERWVANYDGPEEHRASVTKLEGPYPMPEKLAILRSLHEAGFVPPKAVRNKKTFQAGDVVQVKMSAADKYPFFTGADLSGLVVKEVGQREILCETLKGGREIVIKAAKHLSAAPELAEDGQADQVEGVDVSGYTVVSHGQTGGINAGMINA